MSSIVTRDETKQDLTAFQRWWQSSRNQRRVELTLKLLLAAIVITFSLLPIIYTLLAAFNRSGGLSTNWFAVDFSTVNFEQILTEEPFFRWVGNSTLLASISSVFSVAMTTLAAFAFSRFRFAGRSQLLLVILIVQVFPALLAMVALFGVLQTIGQYIPFAGLNSYGGLILIYMGGALGINVWLMKGFFDSIPRAIDESAMVDGATHWQIFIHLIFPLVRPILIVVAILSFFGVYSDWLLVRIMIQDTDKYTLMLGLQTFLGDNYGEDWGAFAAGALMGAIPMVIVYILLQDQIVGGLTSGSVKG